MYVEEGIARPGDSQKHQHLQAIKQGAGGSNAIDAKEGSMREDAWNMCF